MGLCSGWARQSAFLHSARNVLEQARVSNVGHKNFHDLEKLLFKHPNFFLKPYELDYPHAEASNCPLMITPWAKKIHSVFHVAKEKRNTSKVGLPSHDGTHMI